MMFVCGSDLEAWLIGVFTSSARSLRFSALLTVRWQHHCLRLQWCHSPVSDLDGASLLLSVYYVMNGYW